MAAPNPFAPPGADVTPPESRPPGAPWKAVLVGFAVDVAFSIVFAFILSIAYGAYLAMTGRSAEEISSMIADSKLGDFYTGAILAIGGIGSMLGGYICARIARRNEYRVAGVLTAISVVLGWLLTAGREEGGQLFLSTNLTIVATMAGALLGARRNRSRR